MGSPVGTIDKTKLTAGLDAITRVKPPTLIAPVVKHFILSKNYPAQISAGQLFTYRKMYFESSLHLSAVFCNIHRVRHCMDF